MTVIRTIYKPTAPKRARLASFVVFVGFRYDNKLPVVMKIILASRPPLINLPI